MPVLHPMQNHSTTNDLSPCTDLKTGQISVPSIDGIIFDLDGTLWDSTAVVAKAWSTVLKQHPEVSFESTPDNLKNLFGRPLPVIADMIMPDLEPEKRYKIIDACCEEEHRALKITPGALYPRLEETLADLNSRYPLFIVSNCQAGYIETFLEVTGLGGYFQDFECPGRSGLIKGPNNKLVMERNHLTCPVYVGDTQGDKDSAVYAGIAFCHASYGFGTVDSCDFKIRTFSDLSVLF
ncbi:MAG: HAD family hydrolase [Lachnospiraceae bacterium]|nr:HAD family hydrolase [Lachnospiraceae bacterium]MDY4970166.1 HAD family hydrolase [Lachnospiraceae bacterium]